MSKRPNPAKQYQSYEVILHEDEETGDMIVPLPPQILKELDWKEGDEVDMEIDDKGKIYIRKLPK